MISCDVISGNDSARLLYMYMWWDNLIYRPFLLNDETAIHKSSNLSNDQRYLTTTFGHILSLQYFLLPIHIASHFDRFSLRPHIYS